MRFHEHFDIEKLMQQNVQIQNEMRAREHERVK